MRCTVNAEACVKLRKPPLINSPVTPPKPPHFTTKQDWPWHPGSKVGKRQEGLEQISHMHSSPLWSPWWLYSPEQTAITALCLEGKLACVHPCWLCQQAVDWPLKLVGGKCIGTFTRSLSSFLRSSCMACLVLLNAVLNYLMDILFPGK